MGPSIIHSAHASGDSASEGPPAALMHHKMYGMALHARCHRLAGLLTFRPALQTFLRELRKQLLLGFLSAGMAIGGMWLFGFPLPWSDAEEQAQSPAPQLARK